MNYHTFFHCIKITLPKALLRSNPFNPSTTIRFALPRAARVKLEILNIPGQRAAILVDRQKPAGYHEVKFDGRKFASGVYFYRIQTADFAATRKMVLRR